MPGIIPSFLNVSTSNVIDTGWKTICVIPTGSVTITNNLNPNQSMVINSAISIGVGDPDIGFWEQISITGTAVVIVNGSAIT